MHAHFTALDGERFLRVPVRGNELDWAAAQIGGPHGPWQRLGAGEKFISDTELAAVAQAQAAMPIAADDLPDNLKPPTAWPQPPHASAKVARRNRCSDSL